MKEAAITHSPHAFVPKKELTEEERRERYRTRIDESIRPYTVIDVLTRVYHRSFPICANDAKRARRRKNGGRPWSLWKCRPTSCRDI